MNQPSNSIDDELLREKIKAVLADPNLRLRMTKASPLEEWSVRIEVNLNPQPMVSLEEMEARGGKVQVFHVNISSPGGPLDSAGDAHSDLLQSHLNSGCDGLSQGVSEAPFVGSDFDGFAGLKLDVELAGAGADDGDGELDHTTEPITKAVLKAS